MSVPTETIISEISEDRILAEKGFYWREKDGVKLLVCHALEEAGFANGFSTRGGGVSDFPEKSLNLAGYDEDPAENIEENRRRLLTLFDKNYMLSTVWQIHSDFVKVVKTFDQASETDEKYDALVSDLDYLLIGVKTADCVPVLLGDPKNHAFAAVHAGWRGTVESIVPAAIKKMTENFGTDPHDLIVAIGAAALGCCYEIGQDVVDQFEQNFSYAPDLFEPTRDGHARIDLHMANFRQLTEAAVAAENIYSAPLCTIDRIDLFFSYRVEKRKFGKTGRLLSVIGKS
jgi:YfiH family protein